MRKREKIQAAGRSTYYPWISWRKGDSVRRNRIRGRGQDSNDILGLDRKLRESLHHWGFTKLARTWERRSNLHPR